jgi:hypothetical protein
VAIAVFGGALGAPRTWALPSCNPGGGGHGTAEDPCLIGTTNPPFTGTYDCGGHRISGLMVSSVLVNDTGLFGLVQSAEIKNVAFAGASLDDGANGRSRIGVFVGRTLQSTLSNGHVIGATITLFRDDAQVGALVGAMESSSISGSSASGTAAPVTG